MLDQKIIDKLDAEFDHGRVKVKEIKGRPDASYLESYDVINKANEVFGYGQWGTSVSDIKIEEANNKTICTAIVRLDVSGCLPHEDAGVVIAAQKQGEPLTAEALETAIKGAVSDGMKRNFRHYGKQFGNDLYAKDEHAPKEKKGKPAKAAKKPKAEHASVQYWRYVRENQIDEDYAKQILAGLGNAFEQALEELKSGD